MPKKVLFVTYGGGHARMIVPVVQALQGHKDIVAESIALTVGGPIFKSEGLPYKGYKDFITPADKEALAWGKKLSAGNHNPESGITEEESIAYLGLSYWDLVTRWGEKEAARLWAEKGRHAFLQLTVFERIIAQVKPDMVVTTNSPKSEQAAVAVAKGYGIPTISMVDLFGIHHFHPLESDYITILCERVIGNLEREGVHKPRESYCITGNPAFDRAFDFRGPVDYAWRSKHFPTLGKNNKTLLWIDMPAYWNVHTRSLHVRDDAEVLRDLDMFADAAKANGVTLLIRPHPSQQRGLYDKWMKERNLPHVLFAGGVPLYPLLNAVDVVATYTSTVSVEALLMQKRVVQLKFYPGHCDVPLGEWNIAWLVEKPEQLTEKIRQAFSDEAEAERMRTRVTDLLPQEKAGPKVAALIEKLLLVTPEVLKTSAV